MTGESEPLISGDSGSQPLEAVWNRFGDQLRRRARTRLRQYGLTGQAESMDICNDVMADMARRYGGQGVTPDHALAYILRAIDNQVLDTFRTLARQCRDFRRNELTPVDDMTVANREVTPSQIALRREVLTRIRSMLSEEDAKAIDMMLENRDWNEIGELLGLKADTARMRVRRALDRVRRDIGIGDEDA
jgi:RNA polymerase sigma factor (sigma-70 family)